jgi:hypothetical protein
VQLTPVRLIGWSFALILGAVAWGIVVTALVFTYQIARGL